MDTAVVILAAGKGTRMNSNRPKVMHEIGNFPMLSHCIKTAHQINPWKVITVLGHGRTEIKQFLQGSKKSIEVVIQEEQLGTGHAVKVATKQLSNFDGNLIVMYGDTPFISYDTLIKIKAKCDQMDLVVLGFCTENSAGYGRLVTNSNELLKIVEHNDATEDELAINICNTGVIAGNSLLIAQLLEDLDRENNNNEFYLTDCVHQAKLRGLNCGFLVCEKNEALGINSRDQLSQAEKNFQTTARNQASENGVHLIAPETVFFSMDTKLGRDTVVEPNVIFGKGVTIGSKCIIKAFSYLEGCQISDECSIGPYARLRPGVDLSDGVKIGNFVEIKNSEVAENTKINHLSYVGDARIGKNTNIGAGTVTCNYDGVSKHQTVIGEDVFIGSNTMLIAPVTVGNNSMTGSGSVITKEVPADGLAISRSKQKNNNDGAKKFRETLRNKKNNETY
jgi:bifunctional UDP-N-acetylglucosamine pyrophosphorylase/glucosamine-1-phosphate N-acetyltransferase